MRQASGSYGRSDGLRYVLIYYNVVIYSGPYVCDFLAESYLFFIFTADG